MNRLLRCLLSLILMLLAAGCMPMAGRPEVNITDRPIFNSQRLELTREYSKAHYGIDGWHIPEPRMIVVHYTAFPDLARTMAFFTPTLLSREDIKSGGSVNVSAHFMVDKDGAIFRLAQEDVICRHTIGFNHVALGIENVAEDKDALTDAQLEADATLIADLMVRYPSIRYVVGHHEYQDSSLPHFALNKELDSSYKPTIKIDPGEQYMSRLRGILKNKYGLEPER